MAQSNFEKLLVYQLSEKLADEIWKTAKKWDSFARDTVGKQIVRAGDSVGANIAEGAGRGTYADNCRFITMARGSLYETKHWLRRAYVRSLLRAEQVSRIKVIVDNLTPMLNAYLKSIGRMAKKRKR